MALDQRVEPGQNFLELRQLQRPLGPQPLDLRLQGRVHQMRRQIAPGFQQRPVRIAQIGKWYEPEKLMGYAVAIYIAKLLIWDKVLGLGSTDPLGGWIETTANLVVSFYFAKRGFENVARIIKR